jgi:hypothetical protein
LDENIPWWRPPNNFDRSSKEYLRNRFSVLFEHTATKPPKVMGDPITGSCLNNMRMEFRQKAKWVTEENLEYLDQTIPWWRPQEKKK